MKKQDNQVTLKTVADCLGLSITTVSMVINKSKGYQRISEKTSRKILQACETLGYKPNFFAQRLKSDRTMQIAAIVPSLYNHFTAPLIEGIESVLHPQGYNLLIFNYEEEKQPQDSVRDPLTRLLVGGIDGVISHIGKAQIESLVSGRLPVIHIDEDIDVTPGVSVDVEKAIYTLTKLFIDHGCTKIAFIGAREREQFTYTFYGRRKGYERAMKEHGLAVDPKWMTFVTPTYNGGFEAFDWINQLEELPEAVVVYTDIVAHVLQSRMVQAGMHIPQDIGIGSLDDTFFSQLMIPPLTSVRIPAFDIGVRAAQLILAAIDGEDVSRVHDRLKTELHERESSQVFPHKKN